MAEQQILCPKCGSDQVTANKKGFSGRKAVAGAVLTGGIGLLAGTLGSNKIKITCLSCGHQFKPGQGASSQADFVEKKKQDSTATKWTLIILAALLLIGYLTTKFGSNSKETSEKSESNYSGTYTTLTNATQQTLMSQITLIALQGADTASIRNSIDSLITANFASGTTTIKDWEGEMWAGSKTDGKGNMTDKGNYLYVNLDAGKLTSEFVDLNMSVHQVDNSSQEKNLLKKGTLAYDKARQIKPNQKVKFSADFISFDPTRVTINGDKKMIEVRLKTKLTDID